jgi:hypothetical protein
MSLEHLFYFYFNIEKFGSQNLFVFLPKVALTELVEGVFFKELTLGI